MLHFSCCFRRGSLSWGAFGSAQAGDGQTDGNLSCTCSRRPCIALESGDTGDGRTVEDESDEDTSDRSSVLWSEMSDYLWFYNVTTTHSPCRDEQLQASDVGWGAEPSVRVTARRGLKILEVTLGIINVHEEFLPVCLSSTVYVFFYLNVHTKMLTCNLTKWEKTGILEIFRNNEKSSLNTQIIILVIKWH